MKAYTLLLGIFFIISSHLFTEATYAAPDSIQSTSHAMSIQLNINSHKLHATLNNSQAARDFLNQLPLTLTLKDYAGVEKNSTLPRKLSTVDSPAGSSAKAGDIAHYAPWGNLVLYYQDAPYANGLVILGHINGDISLLHDKGDLRVTIEDTQ